MATLNINGKNHKVDVEPDMPLLWVLRDMLGLTGTKYGCGIAQCGACLVHLDGKPAYACAVPGILATRTIPSPRDRLATILAAPSTTCSARLPVYALLIGAFFPAEPVLGPLTWQGMALLLLYLIGAASALLAAAVFKRRLLRG